MNLKFAIPTALLSLTGLVASTAVPRQNCPEVLRFGNPNISPNTAKPGDNVTISVDLSCAINTFGIVPKFLDFTFVLAEPVPTNGHPNIVLARRDFDSSTGSTLDEFTAQVPFASEYFATAPYTVILTTTYPVIGTDGSEVLIQGSIGANLNITV